MTRNRFSEPVNYVCGFAFDANTAREALVRKNKPAWQAGLLNGIGGHVEPCETLEHAMAREFEEEAGLATLPSIWRPMLFLQDGSDKAAWIVHFFAAYGVDLDKIRTVEEEEIIALSWQSVAGCHNERQVYYAHVPNLEWLLPMAAQRQVRGGSLRDFTGVGG